MKIKKGDHVVVIAGKDKGTSGTVIAAYPDRQKVLVQGVNMIKKNKKVSYQGARGAKEGGIVTEEGPIHVSNVALVDAETKKPARVGYKIEDGKKVRVTRPSGKEV
jgi:large subunit ribosomal protein L24